MGYIHTVVQVFCAYFINNFRRPNFDGQILTTADDKRAFYAENDRKEIEKKIRWPRRKQKMIVTGPPEKI